MKWPVALALAAVLPWATAEISASNDIVAARDRLESFVQSVGCAATAAEITGTTGKMALIYVWCRRMKTFDPPVPEAQQPGDTYQ